MKRILAVCAFSLVAVACGPQAIATTAPAGKINGAAWSMTKSVVKKSGTTLSVNLYAEDVADCAAPLKTTSPSVMWSMPAAEGTRELNFNLFDLGNPKTQTVTFFTPSDNGNNVITEGRLEVSKLSDTSVTVGLLAKGDADNQVEGTFTATLCPSN